MLRYFRILRHLGASLLPTQISFSTGEFGPLILPGKENKSVEADFVNYGSSGVYFVAYNQDGFLLNSGVKIVGPCAAFPRNAFCWNVKDAGDIDEASLSLFFILEPRLDMLIIGKGETSSKINYRGILDICSKHGIGAEIMPTHHAIGTFNYLNSEGRYVGAALIPPSRIDIYDKADQEAEKRLLSRIEQETTEYLPEQSDVPPKLLISSEFTGLTEPMPRSPLQPKQNKPEDT